MYLSKNLGVGRDKGLQGSRIFAFTVDVCDLPRGTLRSLEALSKQTPGPSEY